MSDLTELRARVATATGPSAVLDLDVHMTVEPAAFPKGWSWGVDRPLPVTDSLDAALALAQRVLPGWRIGVNSDPHRHPLWSAQMRPSGERWVPIGHLAPTPALAVLSAMLAALQPDSALTYDEADAADAARHRAALTTTTFHQED